jgi:CheY-like chemotaxis protein
MDLSARMPGFEEGVAMARILIVDDNEMNRDTLSRRLERKGYTITLAVDGGAGVDKAAAEVPDLILMDMSLPVLDGWEATRRVKANPLTKHIPVIALTAHAMTSDRDRAMEAGCDDYDTKPIDLARLLSKIEMQLRKKKAAHGG